DGQAPDVPGGADARRAARGAGRAARRRAGVGVRPARGRARGRGAGHERRAGAAGGPRPGGARPLGRGGGGRAVTPAPGPADGPGLGEVDAAVRSVLAERLGRGARAPDASGEVFAGRLLALRHVEAMPAGVRLVRVAPGTVITPLARDHLKRLGVEVR